MEILNKSERDLIMLGELSKLAIPHIESSKGSLELLDIDPEKHPSQLEVHVEGDPQPAAVIESIASIAAPNFMSLVEKLNIAELENREISRIGELIKGGNNVIIATNHSNLIDIALVEAAVYCSLAKLDYQIKTGIIISKMVAMLGYRLGNDSAPCTDVLKLLCNDIFLSFPRTESIKKSKINRLLPNEIDRNNRLMLRLVRDKLNKGGMLLAIAPSGSKDRRNDNNSFSMQTLKSGTIGLISHPKTYVMPVAVWLAEEQPFIEITDIPRTMTNESDVHNMMSGIAETLSKNIVGLNFNYQSPKNFGKIALS